MRNLVFVMATFSIFTSGVAVAAQGKTGCILGDCRTGIGIYVFGSGNRYEGNFENGKQTGQGKLFDSYRNVLIEDNSVGQTGIWKELNGYEELVWYADDRVTSSDYSGQFSEVESNGKFTREGYFKNGFRDGLWETRYEDHIYSQTIYQNGFQQKLTMFHGDFNIKRAKLPGDGFKRLECTYLYETPIKNTCVYWYRNGQKKEAGGWNKRGDSEGAWVEWYESGIKKSEGTYLDGEKNNDWSYWNETGERKYKTLHSGWTVNGKIVPPQCFVYEWLSGDNYEAFSTKFDISNFADFVENTGRYLGNEISNLEPIGDYAIVTDVDDCIARKHHIYADEKRINGDPVEDKGGYYYSDYSLISPVSTTICRNLAPNISGSCEKAFLVRLSSYGGGSLGPIQHYTVYGQFKLSSNKRIIAPLKYFEDSYSDAVRFIESSSVD